MTKFKIDEKFIIHGLDIGMILYEINLVEDWMKENGVEDADTVFSETRRVIEKTLKRKVNE